MRLLKIQHDGSLTLTEDLIENIPQYAILSHTWEDDNQEVTFKDILEGTGQQKEGYRKIKFCRNQAVFDDLQHLWVDTCCIDRFNSTELSEAINSMYQWYKNATKCYVYLSDVSKSSTDRVEEPLRSTWKKEFRESRWFTRGWTLQELIAPSSVEFFTWKDQRLGDKISLQQLIHEITGIPIDVLGGRPLSNFSINERMLWSNGRKTKKAEDKAYSLMGIFDVHMPLIYGEGEKKALSRLQREIDKELGKQVVLDKLPIAAGAAFDSHAEEHSPACLPNTRVDLLREISKWVEDPEAKAVFWLNGMAGTGKSTISRTLARSSSDHDQLGASFFFKRGEGDRGRVSKLFTTVTAQLVQREPALAPHVKDAIVNDPAICGKSLQEQFERLILEPLSKRSSRDRKANVVTIIIDALDECDEDDDIIRIIHLFSRANALKSPRLRIFLTSRPELPLRLGFKEIESKYQDIVLHEIDESIIKHDLSVYFKHELAKIKKEYNNLVRQDRQLPSNWPEQSHVQTLVTMAIPLFIFAATACRFLADRKIGNPDTKLRRILEHQTKSQESKLDKTYLPVLEQLVVDLPDSEKNEVLELFKHLVGSIILLANPLSVYALADLLDIPVRTIEDQLDFLHSVLSVPSLPSYPVRLLHLSFRDFLLDPSKCGKIPFWVDEKVAHKKIATHCIRVMNNTLRRDICGVKWPGTPHASIDSQIINDRLAPEVQYACQYWVYHVQQSGDRLLDDDQVHNFLQQHFLHLLEALSLIGRASESLPSLRILQSLCQSSGCFQLLHFVNDALRFNLVNISTIQAAPLQVYASALTFAPETSIVRKVFQSDAPSWVSLISGVDVYWSDCLQTLESHTDSVHSIAFSPDGKFIASASRDQSIRLWLANTGALQQTFEEPDTDYVTSVAFSPKSKIIASGSQKNAVRLWSVDTGALQQTLEGHTKEVTSVAFSPDSKVVASGSFDETVRLWSADTGALQQTLEGHTDWVTSVAFSPDSKVVASGSYDETVRLWSADTGALQQTLEGHTELVLSVAFSPDNKVIASGSGDKTVRLWSANMGLLQQTLEGHTDGVSSVAFSPDGKVIASGSHDSSIRLWSADTGALQYTFKSYGLSVESVAFSPNGQIVASGSVDGAVRLWPVDIGAQQGHKGNTCYVGSIALQQTLEAHAKSIQSIAFSPDGKIVASGSKDQTIRLWSANTSALQYTLKGHTDGVNNITFSLDGKVIASSSFDGTVRLWSTNTGTLQRTLKGHITRVGPMKFSLNGKVIASGSETTVRLWSTDTANTNRRIVRYIPCSDLA